MFLCVEGEDVNGKFCCLGVSYPDGRSLKRHDKSFLGILEQDLAL